MNKRIGIIGLIFFLLIGMGSTAGAKSQGAKLKIDEKVLNDGIMIKDGSMLISQQLLEKQLGIKVDYQENLYRFSKGDIKFTMNNDTHILLYGAKASHIDTAIVRQNNQVYFPLKYISYTMGYDLKWDKQAKLVTVDTKFKEHITNVNMKVLSGPTAVSAANFINQAIFVGPHTHVNVEILSQPQLANASVLSKEADIVTLPTNTAAILFNKKADYKVAGVILWGNLYLASTEIKEIKDIKGKEIFLTGKGATPDIVLRMKLKDLGLNPDKDVKLTYLPGAQELAAYMISGKAKTAVLPEPILTKVLMNNKKASMIDDFQKYWQKKYKTALGYPQTVIFIKNDLLKKSPNIVDALLSEYAYGVEQIEKHPEIMAREGAKLDIGLNEAVLKQALPRSYFSYQNAAEAKKSIEAYLKALYDFDKKTIGGKMPSESFYYIK